MGEIIFQFCQNLNDTAPENMTDKQTRTGLNLLLCLFFEYDAFDSSHKFVIT